MDTKCGRCSDIQNAINGLPRIPKYYIEGDCLMYFTNEDKCRPVRVDKTLTVYVSDDGDFVGCKIGGVRHALTCGRNPVFQVRPGC